MLTVERLVVARAGRVIASGIDLCLGEGAMLQVHGPNGSGKSSLLAVLAGLIEPAAGTVRWRGGDIARHPGALRRELAYLGHAAGMRDELTVLENLRFAQALAGSEAGPTHATLAGAGLWHVRDTALGMLSQGQRRRVALARLVLGRRTFWLLDEPADALDAAALGWFESCLDAHLEDGGVAAASTHRPLATPAARTRHLHLARGRAWLA